MTDMYQRPDRDEIARQVNGALPGGDSRACPECKAPRPDHRHGCTKAPGGSPQAAPDPLRAFAAHLSARMRALGWDQAALMEHAGITSPQIAARAINGTGVALDLAGKLAAIVGLTLPQMLGPYECGTCQGGPPAGFTCQECGTEGTRL